VDSIEKWDDHSLHAGVYLQLLSTEVFSALQFIEAPYLSNGAHSYIRNIIHILLSRAPDVLTVVPRAVHENWQFERKERLGSFLFSNN
jgi:hypothetical protein